MNGEDLYNEADLLDDRMANVEDIKEDLEKAYSRMRDLSHDDVVIPLSDAIKGLECTSDALFDVSAYLKMKVEKDG